MIKFCFSRLCTCHPRTCTSGCKVWQHWSQLRWWCKTQDWPLYNAGSDRCLIADTEPPYRVQCSRPVKKSTIQKLYTASEMSSERIFWNNVVCLTVSKALLKSPAKTTTCGLVLFSYGKQQSYQSCSGESGWPKCVLVGEIEWSWRDDNSWTQISSSQWLAPIIYQELMWWISVVQLMSCSLRDGRMQACFHWQGTVEVTTDLLNRRVPGL